ncbi:cysteine desulfurase family protein [Anaerosalibacter massiliensis]|uniref:Cysteine desulfurase n=1 Tax=Anaerosalibacter massiliensis TaxID=1347392 RepID=A0A9X2ML03_9FIRM|nr:cysteine desulfurase family protein [Anaerosalibacter massiliensis]MCR2045544.1 cysteine desulfurase [Anaerosalibacter massiliensis]
MEVYLDNCATTKPREEVIDEINFMLKKSYGNPSSLHRLGFNAEKKVEESREIISGFLNVNNDEIYFTSGGTESNNIAIQGLVNKNKKRGNHIITTEIEHPSVLNIFKYYESKGFDITYLKVDRFGFIDLNELEKSIKDSTILISIMLVNNEIGTIEPVGEIRKILDKKASNAYIHLDGIQALGKIPLELNKWSIDTFSFSGHKIHGPKGIGGLYIRKGTNISPIIYGGNQEREIRSGTENTLGIVGMGKAVEIVKNNFNKENKYVRELKNYMHEKIMTNIPEIKVNSLLDESFSPYILNISFLGVRGEVLLHYLENKGIYVSTGSACSSHGKGKSHVLKAIGLNNNEIEGAIRFSLSHLNTKNDINYVVEELKKSVEDIRQITMR